jgi:hypothetical protein
MGCLWFLVFGCQLQCKPVAISLTYVELADKNKAKIKNLLFAIFFGFISRGI